MSENNIEQAEADLKAAIEKSPDDPEILVTYADSLVVRNEKQAALHVLEKAVSLYPELPFVYAPLSALDYYTNADHPHISQLTRLLQNEEVPSRRRRRIHYILGEVFDAVQSYDEAFQHYQQANSLECKHPEALSEVTTLTDQTIEVFTRDNLSRHMAVSDDRDEVCPIFIVGMPRSGSTLVEQILASHPSVRALGETRAFDQALNVLESEKRQWYPACMIDADSDQLARVGRHYLEQVAPGEPRAPYVTDKMLFNYLNLGVISLIFPGARIIHCKRTALDTCLSCYFQQFAAIKWSDDLMTIANIYRQYERLMAHWSSVLQIPVLEVEYKYLVAEPELWVHRLVDYCGLPWSDDCLQFHRTRRRAHTASEYQVKSPIYTKSVDRWRNYERHIGDLIEFFKPPGNGKQAAPQLEESVVLAAVD